jgi:hypothetical protein
MAGIQIKGTGRAATYPNSNKGYKKGGRIKAAHGWGRTNLLDESRRIRSEPQTRNVIDEEARVRGELNRGFKKGGSVAKKGGGAVLPGKKGKVGIEL